MSFDDERAAIENRLKTYWENQESPPDIVWDNVPYDASRGIAHVRLRITNVGSELAGLASSSKLYRYYGLIMLQFFVPENEGTSKLRTYLDEAETIFRNKQFSGIVTEVPRFYASQTITRDGWYKQILAIPFYRDEVG